VGWPGGRGPWPPDQDMHFSSSADAAMGWLGTSEFEGHMLLCAFHSFGLEDPHM
jgi:hypothetical protein